MHELVKLALSPGALAAMSQSLKGLGSGAGIGGLVGGLGGAAIGAGRGFMRQREQGASMGEAVAGGLSGAVGGLGTGALLGAGAGGLVGAIRPGLAASASRLGSKFQGASNFGQRQVHALTGIGDARYARSIGAGAHDARRRLNTAREAWHGTLGTPGQSKVRQELFNAHRGFEAAQESEQRGLTSIPGYLKSFAKDPMGTLRTGSREQWRSSGPVMKSLMYGLPAAAVGGELLHKEDPTGEGRGRFERAGSSFGLGAAGLVAPLPIAGDIVAGGLLSKGFGRLGRGVDRLVSKRAPASPISSPEPAASVAPSDHVVSDRAAGTIPESLS